MPLPGIWVAIADLEKNVFVESGEQGEIIISGAQVARGYWNQGHGNKFHEAFAEIAGK